MIYYFIYSTYIPHEELFMWNKSNAGNVFSSFPRRRVVANSITFYAKSTGRRERRFVGVLLVLFLLLLLKFFFKNVIKRKTNLFVMKTSWSLNKFVEKWKLIIANCVKFTIIKSCRATRAASMHNHNSVVTHRPLLLLLHISCPTIFVICLPFMYSEVIISSNFH